MKQIIAYVHQFIALVQLEHKYIALVQQITAIMHLLQKNILESVEVFEVTWTISPVPSQSSRVSIGTLKTRVNH